MSKINLSFKGKKYSIDKSLLSGAIASLEATLGALQSGGNGGADRPDYTPYWGEIYSITFLDGFTRCKDEYRLYEDGSVRNEYYENGEHVDDRYFPSGTLTYIGSEVFIDGTLLGETGMILFATMSKDGTQITMVDNGDVYTLQESADAPTEERLEGDGAEYYTLAPTALSFRSTAPLNELQEIQINGVTVDPANYTLEEGSTIVTFPIDYLKTLDVGSYEVAVASDSKTVKGDFNVKAPELNEHGFYYNQPYTAYVDMFGENESFFIRDDGTLDVVGTPSGDISQCTYTCSGNQMTVISPVIGTLTATISDDGTEIYCNELQTAFKLGDTSIVADGDYVYIYKEELGGYEVNAIDKTKAEYGAIKTGINGYPTVKLADVMFNNNTNMVGAPYIPDSVTEIGGGAFEECTSLTSVEVPASVTTIDIYAFCECTNLESVKFGNGSQLTCINANAFSQCFNLTSIKLPDSVTTIGACAFDGCTRLYIITFKGTVAQWNAISKGDYWNASVPATYVQCSDGQVSLV